MLIIRYNNLLLLDNCFGHELWLWRWRLCLSSLLGTVILKLFLPCELTLSRIENTLALQISCCHSVHSAIAQGYVRVKSVRMSFPCLKLLKSHIFALLLVNQLLVLTGGIR